MNYVCLAAGKGSRFGELGRYLQKCMYPIGLMPFLEYSVQSLRRSQTLNVEQDQLVLVVGHHEEQVRNYFGECYDGLAVRYVEQPDPLGTGHAVRVANEAYPAEQCITWLADAYVPTTRFEAIHRHPEANVLTVATDDHEINDDVRVSFDGDQLSKAWQGESDWFEIGLWKFSRQMVESMTAYHGDEIRALPNVQNAIDTGAPVGYVKADEWLHLGGTQPTPAENVLAVNTRLRGIHPTS